MSREQLSASGYAALAIGALLLWIGINLLWRPVEAADAVERWMLRGRPRPGLPRAGPRATKWVLRPWGALIIAIGVWLLYVAVRMFWAGGL